MCRSTDDSNELTEKIIAEVKRVVSAERMVDEITLGSMRNQYALNG